MQKYDATLQMFVQEPQPIQLGRLAFLRWLEETGQGEHGVAGEPSGPLVAEPATEAVAA